MPTDSEIEELINKSQVPNTLSNTNTWVWCLENFWKEANLTYNITEITDIQQLQEELILFFVGLKTKKDHRDYHPNSIKWHYNWEIIFTYIFLSCTDEITTKSPLKEKTNVVNKKLGTKAHFDEVINFDSKKLFRIPFKRAPKEAELIEYNSSQPQIIVQNHMVFIYTVCNKKVALEKNWIIQQIHKIIG